MNTPSVVACQLPEAEAILEAAGLRVASVKETRCPKGAPSGPLRVVRQRQLPEGVELVAAGSVVLQENENGHH
jgi:hypothetical protein